ncbi:MAG: dihydrolipoyl dehydrogenase [Eubacteriales bacterium]|jgi:dihydrolipoamide dehydrogenase
MQKYDLMVIGGGPGGYDAAERAGENGLKVVIFEKRALGGVCLNEGCIPTKTFLNSAKIYSYALRGDSYGVIAKDVSFDHAKVVKRKQKVVKTLVSGVRMKMRQNKVTVVSKKATITGKTDDAITVEADGEVYAAPKLIIATGSVPAVPPIKGLKEGLESGFVMTSREILDIEKLPKSLIVIGGGVIGLEMACYFATVGVKVTVIEMLDRIAGNTDLDISRTLMKTYQKEGMDFYLSSRVTSVGENSVTFEQEGKEQTVVADAVLLSAGRRPRIDDIGLETIGVYTERGAIVTDEYMRTNVAGVYAVGDVNGKSLLAHTAYREADVAVNHILGKKDRMRYDAVPSVIYTNPEVASVGETDESAKEKGMDVRSVRLPLAYSGRYVAEVNNGDGFCKLVLDNKTNKLVGVHMIGSYASEIIYGAALMLETELPAEQLKKLIFPHPTVSEIIREALFHA